MTHSVFEGPRVRLGAMDPERDAKLFVQWDQDSEYQVLLSAGPANRFSAKMVQEWLEKERKGEYEFAIFDRETEKVIGTLGIGGIDWTAGDCWVGIGIGERDYWGKGYGTEALNLLVGFAFLELNMRRVTLNYFEYNERGRKSYDKVGFKEEGRIHNWMNRNGRRWDVIFMGLLRRDWEALQRA